MLLLARKIFKVCVTDVCHRCHTMTKKIEKSVEPKGTVESEQILEKKKERMAPTVDWLDAFNMRIAQMDRPLRLVFEFLRNQMIQDHINVSRFMEEIDAKLYDQDNSIEATIKESNNWLKDNASVFLDTKEALEVYAKEAYECGIKLQKASATFKTIQVACKELIEIEADSRKRFDALNLRWRHCKEEIYQQMKALKKFCVESCPRNPNRGQPS